MIFVKGTCSRCGGNPYWEQYDGSVHCLQCGCILEPGPIKIEWKTHGLNGQDVTQVLVSSPFFMDSQNRRNNRRR